MTFVLSTDSVINMPFIQYLTRKEISFWTTGKARQGDFWWNEMYSISQIIGYCTALAHNIHNESNILALFYEICDCALLLIGVEVLNIARHKLQY